MAVSIFPYKACPPTDDLLGEALGKGMALWDEILQHVAAAGEWKYYTKSAGWTYAVKAGKRTLFYMMPKEGYFFLTFVYGKRAVEAAKTAGLPSGILNDLLHSRAYMEGQSVSVDVKEKANLETVKKMIQLKIDY